MKSGKKDPDGSSVIVYTTDDCPYCRRAKDLLSRKGIPFKEIDLTNDAAKREEVENRYGWMTVPVIVIDGKCIGGSDELYELDRRGAL